MSSGVATALLLAWLRTCALHYGVDPEFAQAVAIIESRASNGPELSMRVGRLGKSRYYGPFGIHKDFLKRWPIDDPFVNVEIGVKALRGADQRRVLRRYNAEFNERYFQAVMAVRRQLKREGKFDG